MFNHRTILRTLVLLTSVVFLFSNWGGGNSANASSIATFKAVSTTTTTRIMPLGDSITVGEGYALTCDDETDLDCYGYREPLWNKLTVENGYDVDFVGSVCPVSQMCSGNFDKNHEGHSGFFANQIRDNIYAPGGDWLSTNPADIVLLHIGTNDIGSPDSAADIAVEIGEILDKIDQYGADNSLVVKVLLAKIIKRSPATNPLNSKTAQLNNEIENLLPTWIATYDHLSIILVNMEDLLTPEVDYADDKHPNQSGYVKMANAWFMAIKELLDPSNVAPIVTDPGDQSDAEGDAVSLQIFANDQDGDDLTYSATGLPPSLTINANTGLISGTLTYSASAGSPYSVEVTVTDNGSPPLDTSVIFSWIVTNTNRPPVIVDPGDQSSAEGEGVSLQIAASDPDTNNLTYSASGLPGSLTIDPNSGLISGVINFGAAADSPYSVQVIAKDDGTPEKDDSVSFSWTVAANNPPDVVNPGFQKSIENEMVSLQIQASDPDEDELIFNATGLPPGLSIDSNSGLIAGMIQEDVLGVHTVQINVSDGFSANDVTISFNWQVDDVLYFPAVFVGN